MVTAGTQPQTRLGVGEQIVGLYQGIEQARTEFNGLSMPPEVSEVFEDLIIEGGYRAASLHTIEQTHRDRIFDAAYTAYFAHQEALAALGHADSKIREQEAALNLLLEEHAGKLVTVRALSPNTTPITRTWESDVPVALRSRHPRQARGTLNRSSYMRPNQLQLRRRLPTVSDGRLLVAILDDNQQPLVSLDVRER